MSLRKLLLAAVIAAFAPVAALANQNAQGWCESGAKPVVVSGLTSTTRVQASYPACTVTIFIHGGGLATIFSDDSGTPLSNPFTATTGGRWQFYAANGHYDVQLSGGQNGGFPQPVVYSDILLADPANQAAAIPNTNLTFSATPAFIATNNIAYTMTLTANVTSSTITGTPANGNILALTLCQDATGGRTFQFPASFVLPSSFSFIVAANQCNYLAFKFNGTTWTFLSQPGTSGGGGGSTPAAPVSAMQYNNGGVLGSTNTKYFPNQTPCFIDATTSCDNLVTTPSATKACLALDAGDGNTTSLCVAPRTGLAPSGAVDTGITGTAVASGASSIAAPISGSAKCIGAACRAIGLVGLASDDASDVATTVNLYGATTQLQLLRSGGQKLNDIFGYEALGYLGAGTETAARAAAFHAPDLAGRGLLSAGLLIEAQTGGGFAVRALGGPSRFDGLVSASSFATTAASAASGGFLDMTSGQSICWRNNADSGDVCLSKNTSDFLVWPGRINVGSGGVGYSGATSGTAILVSAAIGGGTHTLANNTGVLAELNLAQAWTAAQTFSPAIGVPSGGTGATTFTANGVLYGQTTSAVLATAASGVGTFCLVSTNGGAPTWGSCAGSAATAWSSLTNPSADLSLAMGTNNTLFTYGVMTGTRNALELTDGASTSTGSLLSLHTAASSTMKPITITAVGTANGVQMSAAGVLAPLGSGGITANAFSGQVPIANGGTGQATALAAFNALSPLTTQGDILFGGASGSGTRLAAGTVNQVLHGGTSPSWSAVALSAGADVTGQLPIANGGHGQATAVLGFDALAPTTTRGDLIVRGASNNVRLAIGGSGLCLTSNGTDPAWGSCAAGAVGGSATAGQGTFWNAASTIAGSANWTYSAAAGHSVIQGANGTNLLYGKRATDSSPTGNFLQMQNAAAAIDIFKVDVAGNMTLTGNITLPGNGTNAGFIQFIQGVAPAPIANSVQIIAPAAVAASGEQFIMPGTPATGYLRFTNSAGILTGSFAAASGVGGCTAQVVTATNDNAPPSCGPVTGSMFGATNPANFVFAAPNGSIGAPSFRALVGADVPPVSLSASGNGGVGGVLGIANGGTNAANQTAAFNNLSPMTTQGDIIFGGASGAGTRLAPGTSSQVLIGGTSPSWGAVAAGSMLSGQVPIANGGTNGATANAGFNNLSPMTTLGDVIYGGASGVGTRLAGNTTGSTLCLTQTGTGVVSAAPAWGACAGSASTVWSALTDPVAALSLAMALNKSTFTSGVLTGTNGAWEFLDGNSSSTGNFFFVHTGASSTIKPFTATAQGTANGVQMSSAGVLAAIGTGGITATSTTLTITVNTPLTGGGALNTNLTINCAICTTAASSLGNNGVVLGSGGGQGTATSTQLLFSAPTLTVGLTGTSTGILALTGATSGTISIQGQAIAGTYNFNLPTGAGSAGQPLLSGGGGATAMTFGTLGVAAGGTGLTSGTSGGIPYYSGSGTLASSAALTAHGVLVGGGAATSPTSTSAGTSGQCLLSNGASADPTFQTCPSAATSALSGITAAVASNSINNGDNAQVWNWQLTTSGKSAFTFGENVAGNAAGTPYLVNIQTLATSTVNPLVVTAVGTANGIQVLKSGFLTTKGTGGIDSNLLWCDVTDGTKCIKSVLSGLTTATTRNVTWPDAPGTVVFNDNTKTLTNTTLNAESTGNVVSLPTTINIAAAGCNGSTAGNVMDLPTASAMVPVCIGTTTTTGLLGAVDAATTVATFHSTPPANWNVASSVDVTLYYTGSTSSTNNIRWQVSNACVSDGDDLIAPSYNTASASNTAGPTTAGQRKSVTFTGVSVTNCAASDTLYWKFERIGANAGDTYTGDGRLLEATITIRQDF